MPALTKEKRIMALTKWWPKEDMGNPPPLIPPPLTREINRTRCPNCGVKDIPVLEIVTHVEGSSPVVTPNCDRCG